MNFMVIDVETANSDMASICSIGIVEFQHGRVASEWYSLIDPQDYFDGVNVSIHGISESSVKGAPTYAEAAQTFHGMLRDAVVVTHTHFDRVAAHQASSRWAVAEPACIWLDSARVARRAWAQCANKGYGLANVCKLIGYEFQHHNALEDARAAGHVLLAAMAETGLNLTDWLTRVQQPVDTSAAGSEAPIRREGNPVGSLFGEVVVFTGALAIPRREAADLASSVGCTVDSAVTKDTTLLVVGDTDVRRLAGHEKSSKHRKAEDLITRGFRSGSSAKRISGSLCQWRERARLWGKRKPASQPVGPIRPPAPKRQDRAFAALP
jgi:DNA polymerase-3 subunit epsilon